MENISLQAIPGADSQKHALLLMVSITSIIAIGAYIGYLGGANMAGIDSTVEGRPHPLASPGGGIRLMSLLGEPLGFALVGITGGLFTGYFWSELGGNLMIEWLSTDPLNGIIITITFFISVIIGRHLRKKRAAPSIKEN